MSGPVLEPAAQAFAGATANPPYLFDLGPNEGRKTTGSTEMAGVHEPAQHAGRTNRGLT